MSASFDTWRERFERLRANKIFELTVIAIIVLSALLIGARTYDEITHFQQWLRVLDVAVTIFFLVEILIRMAAERRLTDFFKKGWNVFDFLIVTASLIPMDDSEMVLLARLLRIFRVLRLVSMIPELRLLVAALFKSIPRMGYVALLMFIIFYIYAAIGSFLFSDVDERLWGNISLAMLTLFQVATFESWATAVLYPTMEHYPYAWIFFLTFIFLNAFIFLNMMIGIVLDVMQKESIQIELESGEGEAAELHGLRDDVRQLRDQLSRMEAMLERREK
ncbi:ion transporter [Halomonas daqingensis]|uniref:Ion transporter n=2 Tax=Billgrantia desiderata TaxID=52021 RepID=A0AAW4YUN6_9GAMM|nr:ion transporter [Halomonas desiderata]MCE8010576.1 ion transporter [Halomonas desiderata]MCE8030685.1 ion transporter [Halomonas desiderata]MCE8041337.1 ion transporter [Halomonas desiderata]MCE8045912.1 ion transporter [Halomonas desiderata]MCE8051550.1 ion transporter [Halomonas desiderata]